MANKSFIIVSNVAAGGSDTVEHPAAIPSGEKWVISEFGAADVNLGDSKSSTYTLRFGTDILRVISATGNTENMPLKIELEGNGVKKLNVMRKNNSGHLKPCPFWISAFKRQ